MRRQAAEFSHRGKCCKYSSAGKNICRRLFVLYRRYCSPIRARRISNPVPQGICRITCVRCWRVGCEFLDAIEQQPGPGHACHDLSESRDVTQLGIRLACSLSCHLEQGGCGRSTRRSVPALSPQCPRPRLRMHLLPGIGRQ